MSTDFVRHLESFADDLERVRAVMRDNLNADVSLIAEMKNDYLVGGKRVRAVVALLAGRLCGLETSRTDIIAAAIEFIHTATLLHDDVVDNASTRRHLPAAARVYGNAAAVLAGDFLYSRASQMLSGLGQPLLLKRVADATNKLAEGEILQLLARGRTEMDEKTYYAIIHRKTANLFQISASASAVMTDTDEAPLAAYGLHLGTAFQLIDDCLDYVGDVEETGKKIGADFQEGKMTLPLILMLAQLDATARQTLTESWQRGEGFVETLSLVQDCGALAETQKRAKQEADKALDALIKYPDSPAREALQILATTSPHRRS